MFLGSWSINDYLTFPCNTHSPSTGAATDADTPPTYRVYEDNTATPVATGTMTLTDSSNTDGFYLARVQLLAATGFEEGKSYTIRITATVNTTVAAMFHTFQIGTSVDSAQVGDAVLDEVVEGSYTLRQLVRIFASVLAGDVESGTGSVKYFRDLADTKNRVTVDLSTTDRNVTALDGD
jgi:hypothetical protein